MLKKFLFAAVVAAGLSLGSVSNAAEPAKAADPIEVRVCPMASKPVKGDGAGSTVVDKYKVFFCCGGCKGNFDGLSAEEKTKKIEAALKIQEDAKKKG